jgi:hypothetical protein
MKKMRETEMEDKSSTTMMRRSERRDEADMDDIPYSPIPTKVSEWLREVHAPSPVADHISMPMPYTHIIHPSRRSR